MKRKIIVLITLIIASTVAITFSYMTDYKKVSTSVSSASLGLRSEISEIKKNGVKQELNKGVEVLPSDNFIITIKVTNESNVNNLYVKQRYMLTQSKATDLATLGVLTLNGETQFNKYVQSKVIDQPINVGGVLYFDIELNAAARADWGILGQQQDFKIVIDSQIAQFKSEKWLSSDKAYAELTMELE